MTITLYDFRTKPKTVRTGTPQELGITGQLPAGETEFTVVGEYLYRGSPRRILQTVGVVALRLGDVVDVEGLDREVER